MNTLGASMIHTLGLRVAQGAGCWQSSCAASPAVYAAVRSRAVGLGRRRRCARSHQVTNSMKETRLVASAKSGKGQVVGPL